METYYEYQTIPNKKLKKFIIKNETLHKYFELSWGNLKAKQYCGILHVKNEDYYILPKIADKDEQNFDIFIYMLMYAYNVKLSKRRTDAVRSLLMKQGVSASSIEVLPLGEDTNAYSDAEARRVDVNFLIIK